MPERSASEISRPIASTSAIRAPPALPSEMKTSNGWFLSSSVMFTYIVPSGVATRRVATPLGTMYVNITEDDKNQPFEVFISLGKAGGALMADVEAMGRLISLALRSGIPLKEIHRQLRGISSDRVVGLGPNKVMSVPDAIGIAIEKWMHEKQGIQQDLLGGP